MKNMHKHSNVVGAYVFTHIGVLYTLVIVSTRHVGFSVPAFMSASWCIVK